ncbi:MAG: hypothetical protein AAF198_02830 [Pseudomonadota bacterium]
MSELRHTPAKGPRISTVRLNTDNMFTIEILVSEPLTDFDHQTRLQFSETGPTFMRGVYCPAEEKDDDAAYKEGNG